MFPFIFIYKLKVIWALFRFKPDIVITDLEAFSCYFGLLFGKRVVSIDNQHIINAKLEFGNWFERFVIKLMVPFADKYFATTYYYPNKMKKKNIVVPPIIRKELTKIKVQKKDFVLVYQTSKSDEKLVSCLGSLNQRFIVYGLEKDRDMGNVVLKKFDEDIFLKDLANCKAVITNGGFTLIGESLYLGKPVMSVPVRRQFEQIRNAFYLDKSGYGAWYNKFTKKSVEEFINNLKVYEKNLKNYKKHDNKELFFRLKEILRKYDTK
jgi:uncharacterized protein (TIGR00661 family)